jgi:antitoxin component of MazEF toxin-antitoxin module
MIQSTRLTRNGNSISVSIPPVLLRALKWTRGELLLADVVDGALRLRRVDPNSLATRWADLPPSPARRKARR